MKYLKFLTAFFRGLLVSTLTNSITCPIVSLPTLFLKVIITGEKTKFADKISSSYYKIKSELPAHTQKQYLSSRNRETTCLLPLSNIINLMISAAKNLWIK
jgi:hypothetical protein